MKRCFEITAIAILAGLLITACSTTSGAATGIGNTRGYLGPSVDWGETDVDDVKDALVPEKEYIFTSAFDSGWTHQAIVKNRKMKLELGTPPEHLLKSLSDIYGGGRLDASPPTAKAFETSFYYLNEEEGLTLGYSNQNLDGPSKFNSISLYYVDQDAVIKGKFTGHTRFSYDVKLKKGWNVVTKTVGNLATYYKVAEPGRNFKWTILPN